MGAPKAGVSSSRVTGSGSPRRGADIGLRLSVLTMIALVLGLSLINPFSSLSPINRGTGVLLVVMALVLYVRDRIPLAPELFFGFAFAGWCATIGILVARDPDPALTSVRLLVQAWALFFSVAAIVYRLENLATPFRLLLVIDVMLLVYSFWSGEFLQQHHLRETERAEGYIGSPNTTAT